MVSKMFLFLFYVHTGNIDKVYQNCLMRIANRVKDDSEKAQKIGKKRKARDGLEEQEAVQQERPTKIGKILTKHKSITEHVSKITVLSPATDALKPADHVSSETNEDYIPANNCHVTHEISDTEENDSYYYYKGSWQYVLINECKKIKMEVLSFGLLKESDESVPGENRKIEQNDANTAIVNYGLSTETKKDEKNIGFNSFKCKINLVDYDIYHINEMFEKLVLFKQAGQSFVFIILVHVNEEIVMANSKCDMSCYSYFEELENLGISSKTLQMMYILFMTKWLLVYDECLDCWIFKKELLPIHVYFGECYVYVMWKLKHIKLTIEEPYEEIYRKQMLSELKCFCIILDLYKAIEKETKRGNNYRQLIAYMYYNIEQLRNNISDCLRIFHGKTCTMSVYIVASKMMHRSINIKKFKTKIRGNSSKMVTKTKHKKNLLTFHHRMMKGLINTKTYGGYHFGRYRKISLLILAFTADFESIEKNEGGSDILTFIVEAALADKHLDSNANQLLETKTPFFGSSNDIIEFFIMLKELKESDGYFLGDYEYYKKRRISIWSEHFKLARQEKASIYPLNAYREAMLMSIGIDIMNIFEDPNKEQETDESDG